MDQEMIAYFDKNFQSLRQEMTNQISGLRGEMTEKITGLRQEMTGKIDSLREEMTGKIDGLREEMMDQSRLTQILVEDMHAKLQLVAEGYFGIQERLTVFQANVDENFKIVHSTLNVHYRDFNNRLRVVEDRTERKGRDPWDILRELYGKSSSAG
jgi:archaellum component FlaC